MPGSEHLGLNPDTGLVASTGLMMNNINQNKSRKVYKLSKGLSSSSHSQDSGGGEHDSGGETTDYSHQAPLKPHLLQKNLNNNIRKIIHKQPITPMSSNGIDSGLESTGKRPVTQTDSNTSTGSMVVHNANIKLDLERRLMNAATAKREALARDVRRDQIQDFRKVSKSNDQYGDSTANKSQSDFDLTAEQDKNYKKPKHKKKKPLCGTPPISTLALDAKAEQQNNNYIKIKYPPLSTSAGALNFGTSQDVDETSSDDSYIEDVEKTRRKTSHQSSNKSVAKEQLEQSMKLYNESRANDILAGTINTSQVPAPTKQNFESREDFADDEQEDAKSNGSSNQGHEHIKDSGLQHDKKPIVETTAIISKKPVKIELSNQSSLGGILDSGHSSPLHVTTSNSDKDCSCTTTSSEFQSSHHHCCSSETSNSIKNIGNNNNNKKIIEASINKNTIKEEDDVDRLTVEQPTTKQIEERSIVPSSRNKQYVNNSTKAVATFHSNGTTRAQVSPHQTKPGDYAYANKFATTMAKVPSTIKAQPTSKRVNGVTLRDLYSLRAVLSDSDNGTVFSGRRRIDNAAVAIKRIMKSKVKRWHMIKEKSVPMEIALLRKVNETRHAGVVTLLEWFECSDCFLLVMARPTPVLDLFDYVSEKKRLDEATSKMIFIQVVEAMVHCHQRSVLHRDIKLENILVKTDTLISTIIDFGCGTHLHSNLYKDFAGTPQYYPPEYYICKQYHGLPAAVWSVGVMLYAMLCGRLPFASAHEIVHLEPSWHGSFCRKISPAAKDLVEHMLKKQPRRRLQMQEILKHRWLKNAKYDSSTGNVTITTETNNIVTSNSNQIFQEILNTPKEVVSQKNSNSSSGNSSGNSKTFQMFN